MPHLNAVSRRAAVLTFALLAGLILPGCDRSAATSAESASVDPAVPIIPKADQLRDRLDRMIDFTYQQRHPNTKDQAAWQIVHGLLAYGQNLQIRHDGKLVSALDYLLEEGALNGWNLRKGDHGVKTLVEAGSKTGQGHPDQWLGYLSQCGVSLDTPIIVGGETYKINDLLTQAQWDVQDGVEATFTLMALATYLPPDAKWPAHDGTQWTIERVVGMESASTLDDAAWLDHLHESTCGGTHRMYALTAAVKRYSEAGGTLTGSWRQGDERIRLAIAKAREFQQPDGSFSTEFFARAGTSSDTAIKLHATGHTLEFLTLALDDQQLKEEWVTRAVVYLVELLEATQEIDPECGALYHAAHGLQLYRTRCFGERQLTASRGSTAAVPVRGPL